MGTKSFSGRTSILAVHRGTCVIHACVCVCACVFVSVCACVCVGGGWGQEREQQIEHECVGGVCVGGFLNPCVLF